MLGPATQSIRTYDGPQVKLVLVAGGGIEGKGLLFPAEIVVLRARQDIVALPTAVGLES